LSARGGAYDSAFEPPAAVAALRFSAPNSADSVVVRALVDTGADATVVPTSVARRLALPLVDRVTVAGVDGRRSTVAVHAASVEVAGLRCLLRVVALGDEALLGRDLLNRLVAHLDGPALVASFRPPRLGRKRRARRS
jgi:clan AA aspartic protease